MMASIIAQLLSWVTRKKWLRRCVSPRGHVPELCGAFRAPSRCMISSSGYLSIGMHGWCPSIACMKYGQRAHAHCTLLRHGTRSTSGVRHLPQSSGDGGLRAGCRKRRNSLTRCAPWPKVIRCPEPHPNEGLDRPTMPAGMTDEAWIMEALLSHSVPRDFHA